MFDTREKMPIYSAVIHDWQFTNVAIGKRATPFYEHPCAGLKDNQLENDDFYLNPKGSYFHLKFCDLLGLKHIYSNHFYI